MGSVASMRQGVHVVVPRALLRVDVRRTKGDVVSRKEELIQQAQRDIQKHWDGMPYREKRMCENFRDWYVRRYERQGAHHAEPQT